MIFVFEPVAITHAGTQFEEATRGRQVHAIIASVYSNNRANLSVLHEHGAWGPKPSINYDPTGRKHDTWHFPEDEAKK